MSGREPRQRERGAIAILSAISLMVVGAFLALSLNVGHKMNAKAQFQSAFDSAVLAGVRSLNGKPTGVTSAKDGALAFATAHHLDQTAIGIGASDVNVGYWDRTAKTFSTQGQTVTIGDFLITLDSNLNPQFFNAVKVNAATDGSGSHNGPLDVWFGGFVGNPAPMMVGAGAIGVGGGPCADNGCTLPMVVSSCALVDGGGYVLCDTVQTLYFRRAMGRDIALGDITQPSLHVTPGEEPAQVEAAASCTNDPVNVGEVVSLGGTGDFNNSIVNSLHAPTDIVCAAPDPYTGCPRRQMAVVTTGANCVTPSNVNNGGTATIVGFVHVVIVGVNPDPGIDGSISVFIDCSAHSTAPGGCANFGFGADKPRLVQ